MNADYLPALVIACLAFAMAASVAVTGNEGLVLWSHVANLPPVDRKASMRRIGRSCMVMCAGVIAMAVARVFPAAAPVEAPGLVVAVVGAVLTALSSTGFAMDRLDP